MSTTLTPTTESVLDRFYAALAAKDLDAMLNLCAPEARFWHNFDCVAQTLEQAASAWQQLFAGVEAMQLLDIRRSTVDDGLVQRHMFVMKLADGTCIGKPCCLFVSAENGLLTRIDEYIDLSSQLVLDDGVEITSGLPANCRVI